MWDKIRREIQEDIDLLSSGKTKGFTCGLKGIDVNAGRMDGGQVWVIGAYNGIGKSYFVLNMIDGILKEWDQKDRDPDYTPPRMMVFSSELTTKEYIFRHVLKQSQIYKLQLQNKPDRFQQKVVDNLKAYHRERALNPDSLKVYGGVYRWEQIEKCIKDSEIKPNIVFIDYIQDLTIGKFQAEMDAMEVIPQKMKQLALKENIAFVAVAQMNNYSQKSEHNLASTHLAGISHGKKLNSVAQTTIVLTRGKENGVLSKILTANIMKAREGNTGPVGYRISDGYNLLPYEYED